MAETLSAKNETKVIFDIHLFFKKRKKKPTKCQEKKKHMEIILFEKEQVGRLLSLGDLESIN